MSHHAAIFMFQNVAVVHEIANLRKRNAYLHWRDLAFSAPPGRYGSVAFAGSMRDGHVVNQRSGLAVARRRGQHSKLGLMHMEVVILGSDVDQFPWLLDGMIARAEWETHIDIRVIEGRNLLEGSRHRPSARVHLFIAKAEAVFNSSGHTKENASEVARWERFTLRR